LWSLSRGKPREFLLLLRDKKVEYVLITETACDEFLGSPPLSGTVPTARAKEPGAPPPIHSHPPAAYVLAESSGSAIVSNRSSTSSSNPVSLPREQAEAPYCPGKRSPESLVRPASEPEPEARASHRRDAPGTPVREEREPVRSASKSPIRTAPLAASARKTPSAPRASSASAREPNGNPKDIRTT